MGKSSLFIPNKIKVGYQKREDTYTGNLAYVIYYDATGKLRKETSWQNWRNKDIEPSEFDNEPMDGFVLNKPAGGRRNSWSSRNIRNETVRVYDPRNFEIEISIPNLMFILSECDCNKGKGLEGQFVYAWDGTELVLLPTSTQEFNDSRKFTQLQAKKISAKELVQGRIYLSKKQERLVYLGRLIKYDHCERDVNKRERKFHTFRNLDNKERLHIDERFTFLSSTQSLAAVFQEEPVSNYAELRDEYYRSEYGSKIVDLELRNSRNKITYKHFYYQANNEIIAYRDCNGYNEKTRNRIKYRELDRKVCLKDGFVNIEKIRGFSCQDDSFHIKEDNYRWRFYDPPKKVSKFPWIDVDKQDLVVILESGSEFIYNSYRLEKVK